MSVLQTRLNFISIMLIALFSGSITFYGYFLTTTKLSDTSSQNLLTNTTDSWFQPKMKVVLLLVDSLRFDYFHYDESIEGKEQYPYQNKFKKLHQLAKSNPENFVEIRTYADPPTWTVQRIRCLATGNIPPYIRIAQSLSAAEVEEDSIFRQAKKAGMESYTIGDPLWPELFRDTVIDGYRSESFNILDLESEKIVYNITLDAVKRNEYDIVVGHRLGVDHAGHYFETNLGPRTGEQLEQNDDLAIDIINNMDDNTILFILGDHGQRPDGHHGGTTDEETSTVIAAYCKSGFRKYKNPGLDTIMKSLDEKPSDSMMQVNLAPTLSMLLGVPIPFSNLGQIINDFYPNIVNKDSPQDDSTSSFVAQILRDNYLNSLQIYHFLITFQEKTQFFKADHLTSFYVQFKEIQDDYQRVSNINHQTPEFQEQAVQLISKMQVFSESTYQIAKSTSFYDNFAVIVGILLALLVVCAYILLSMRVTLSQKDAKTFQDMQNWSFKKALKEVLTDKFLYCVLVGAALVGVVLRPAAIYVVSSAVLVLVMKAVGTLGMTVHSLRKKVSSSNVGESAFEKIHVELGNVFLSDNQERRTEDEVQTQAYKNTRVYKALSWITKNSYSQVALSVFSMMSVIWAIHFFGWAIVHLNGELIKDHFRPWFISALVYFTVRYVTKRSVLIIALTMIVGFSAYIWAVNPAIPWIEVKTQLSMFIFGYFVYLRVKDLNCSNPKSPLKYLHLATFCTLWFYFTYACAETPNINLYVPRVIFGLLLASTLAGCVLERHCISQNLQLVLLELLLLMQPEEVVSGYVALICLFRFTNFAFKHLNFASFVYPIFIAAESVVGFFLLNHSDRLLGLIKFGMGFVGLNDYNAILSPLMILLNTYSNIILGMIYMVTHLQSIRPKKDGLILRVDEEDTFGQENERSAASSTNIAQPDQDHSIIEQVESSINKGDKQYKMSLLRVRNSVLFVLYVSLVYTSIVFRCYYGRDVFLLLTEGNEMFIYDGAMYLFTLSLIPIIF